MQVRSFESLDIGQAWQRVRKWARTAAMEVPDRLPFEVLDRLYGDQGPPLRPHYEPGPAQLVISSKKSGTVRPFVRLRPTDLILYQALMDQLAPAIESALPPRDQVGAYRQRLQPGDQPFWTTPSNDQFRHNLREAIIAHEDSYVLESDISGYFLGIQLIQLKAALLDTSDRADVVYDLVDLLTQWQTSGVRGLPQGVRPSSPLGNFYIASLDRAMGERDIAFYRWMDDMWAICDSYSEARRVQDSIEQHLYSLGLTLNGEKTRILKAATAAQKLETAARRFEHQRHRMVQDIVETLEGQGEYLDEDEIPDDEDIDREATIQHYSSVVASLGGESLPSTFYADMGLAYRRLEQLGDACALDAIPQVLVRAPDLSATAMRYAASLVDNHGTQVVKIFAQVLEKGRFVRDFEKLNSCHKALLLTRGRQPALGQALARLAIDDRHPLIRAKALLAWGLHSPRSDFETADHFLRSSAPEWRVYALVSIQEKDANGRDKRYKDWAGGNDGLGRVAQLLQEDAIPWAEL